MKFTKSWLSDHLKTSATLEQIEKTLNEIGLEVENIDKGGESFFKVAKILKASKHPNADKLKVCEVDTGKHVVQVVCGANNARDGLFTVFASPGAIIPKNQLKIKITNIRGIESNGMLCSESELNISEESSGIIELSKNKKIGESFFSSNNEPLIDISVTPNRSDCLGVYGIARDLSAKGLGSLKEIKKIDIKNKIKNPFKVTIEKNSGCSAFSYCYIEGVKNIESPKWLKDKILSVGLRPISAIVDITNYIMIDLNRPLHAYDADKISKKHVIVRLSKKNEKFNALDDKEYKLEDGNCLITDKDKILGLGGIIGGASTGVSEKSKNILIESALFEPSLISKTSKKLGINSDASFRFARGVDKNMMVYGSQLAAKLIQEICGGKISNVLISGEKIFNPRKIIFNLSKFSKIIGIPITVKEAIDILKKLGFKINLKKETLNLEVPSWRPDIVEDIDVVEEIIRIKGYDKIKLIEPNQGTVKKDILSFGQKIQRSFIRSIANQGFFQTITYSFTDSKVDTIFKDENKNLYLKNPISSDQNYLRSSLFSNLFSHLRNNINRNFYNQKIFECGPVFSSNKPGDQSLILAGIQSGKLNEKSWIDKDKEVSFYDIKNYVFKALIENGFLEKDLLINQTEDTFYHPSKSCKLNYNSNNFLIASFGEFSPKILKDLDIKISPVFGFELFLNNIESILQKNKFKNKFQISNYQKVERDFSFIIDKETEVGNIIFELKKLNEDIIKKIRVFDVFDGENVEKNKKSVALNFEFQSNEKTLAEKEIDEISKKIINTLEGSFKATLRS